MPGTPETGRMVHRILDPGTVDLLPLPRRSRGSGRVGRGGCSGCHLGTGGRGLAGHRGRGGWSRLNDLGRRVRVVAESEFTVNQERHADDQEHQRAEQDGQNGQVRTSGSEAACCSALALVLSTENGQEQATSHSHSRRHHQDPGPERVGATPHGGDRSRGGSRGRLSADDAGQLFGLRLLGLGLVQLLWEPVRLQVVREVAEAILTDADFQSPREVGDQPRFGVDMAIADRDHSVLGGRDAEDLLEGVLSVVRLVVGVGVDDHELVGRSLHHPGLNGFPGPLGSGHESR